MYQSLSSWQPVPVRRAFIPKASNRAKLKSLGIPVLMDRCHQARVRNALEPEWEARFEARSYGFRPARGCHDAIEAIYATCKGPPSKRTWIPDADLAAAFDKIDHDRLLASLGSFPARDMIRGWLEAGVFEDWAGSRVPSSNRRAAARPLLTATRATRRQTGGLISTASEHAGTLASVWFSMDIVAGRRPRISDGTTIPPPFSQWFRAVLP